MPFSEKLKLATKKRAHFFCCLCKDFGVVEVHHIIPQEEGGPDTEDNAAPLCPSCHEIFGANPQRRKFIREARDAWYEICERRYASDPDRLDKIEKKIDNTATKEDLAAAVKQILDIQMPPRIQELEKELGAKTSAIEYLKKRQIITDIGVEAVKSASEGRSQTLYARAAKAYVIPAPILWEQMNMNQKLIEDISMRGFNGGPVPEDPVHQLLYYWSKQYHIAGEFHTAMNEATSLIPALLVEYDKNPNRSIEDILTAWIEGLPDS